MLTPSQKNILEKTQLSLSNLIQDLEVVLHQLETEYEELPRHRQKSEDGSEIQDTIERLKALIDEVENAADLADDISVS